MQRILLSALTLISLSASATELTDAEVRKIDKDAGKVTLKHGEIKNLEMPPMTMVFKVKEPAMLETLNVGDKIKIAAEKIGGSYTVTRIEKPAAK
ncbi:MAG: copper-binding protein [Burkholderiales bacterium]|nr:copper-binding protein [Burkholderiales bacterium]